MTAGLRDLIVSSCKSPRIEHHGLIVLGLRTFASPGDVQLTWEHLGLVTRRVILIR